MLLERFLKRCISNYEQVEDPNVRKAYGTCSSVVGICCNILLFVLKYVMGTLSHSIAIVSDAFNNLSDCASWRCWFCQLESSFGWRGSTPNWGNGYSPR